MKRRISSIFLVVVMIATVFAVGVPMNVSAALDVDADGPYGTKDDPFYEGDAVTFEAVIIGGDPNDYQFRWDANGDGEFDGPGSAPDFWGFKGETDYTHLFCDDFYEQALVEAWDGTSPTIYTDTADIWVENVAPILINPIATPSVAYVGDEIEFTASFFDDGICDEWEYRWDFGDGAITDWMDVVKYSGGAKILFCTSWTYEIDEIHTTLDTELDNFDIQIDEYDFGPLGENAAPDLDLLLNYDVVVVGEKETSTQQVRNDIGDVLADYSDLGGNVVSMWISDMDDWSLGEGGIMGRWLDEVYNIFIPSDLKFTSVSLGTVYDPSHPIMQGVSSLTTDFSYYSPGVTAGTTLLADDSSGYPFVGYKTMPGGGRIVGIAMFPHPSYCTGDYMKLTANAVKWASQQPDLIPLPMPIQLPLISHVFLEPDTYDAEIVVKDDDGDVSSATTTVTVKPKELIETWSGPRGPHGVTGTYITFFTSFDGNTWAVLGPAGLKTGKVMLDGDLHISDDVPESSGGESSIVLLNLDMEFSDTIVRTTITHNSNNGGGITARGGFSTSGGFGYALVVDGRAGIIAHKRIEIAGTTRLAEAPIPDYDPSNTYELEFALIGDTLRGRVFLDGMEVACAVATDTTFESGYVGLFGTTTVGQILPLVSDAPLNVTFGDFTAIKKPGPKGLKTDAISDLEAAKTGDKKIDKKIDKAIKHIEKSLEDKRWVDESHLDSKHGKKVFDEEKKAVNHLKKLIKDKKVPDSVKDVCRKVIDKLIEADDLLAHTAYDEAQAYVGDKKVDKELEKCDKEFEKAQKDLDRTKKDGTPDPKYNKAINHYKKVWEYAQKAIKHAEKD
jgi:hypothetical protein